MKRAFSLVLVLFALILSLVSCKESRSITIDASKAVNFRCESYIATSGKSYELDKSLSVKLYNQCYDGKSSAEELDIKVNITDGFIDLVFVGDTADENALIVDEKANYGAFTVYSNDIVFFKYDKVRKFYQFEEGFYNFVKTQILIFS